MAVPDSSTTGCGGPVLPTHVSNAPTCTRLSHPGVKIEPSIYTRVVYRPGSHLLLFWIVAVEVDHKLVIRPMRRALASWTPPLARCEICAAGQLSPRSPRSCAHARTLTRTNTIAFPLKRSADSHTSSAPVKGERVGRVSVELAFHPALCRVGTYAGIERIFP